MNVGDNGSSMFGAAGRPMVRNDEVPMMMMFGDG